MNIKSNRQIEVARSEVEMEAKLELLQEQGYAESDIHVISKESVHLETLNRHSEVSTHEAGTFMDKFKSWFTGEDAITEGLRKLDLNEYETERYSKEVANGSIVLYTDVLTLEDETISSYAKEQGFTPSTNEFVNQTDSNFDEPQDRFAQGETFATDTYLAREENYTGHSMLEDRIVREKRPSFNENFTDEQKNYGDQSPGSDPNLGPAAFGSELLVEEVEVHTPEQYEEKLERERRLEERRPSNRIN